MSKEDRDERLQRLKDEIEGAFRDIPYPGDDNIAANKRDEYEEGLAEFKGKHWKDITFEFLVPYHKSSAHFLTPEAYRFYLPAYLMVVAEYYYESDALSGNIIRDLVLPDEGKYEKWKRNCDEFYERFEPLNAEQKRAIRSFLEFIRDVYPYDPIYNDHVVALERYWQYM
ncbi:MAG: DUF6714 family protein [Planctomycetota bacterium]|jgi:hypothetical protein